MKSVRSRPAFLVLPVAVAALAAALAAPCPGQGIEVVESCSVEGASPVSGVIQASDGLLYGTTTLGAAHSWGAIFQLHTDGSNPTKLFDFDPAGSGVVPNGLVEGSDHALYGTTRNGGANFYGTIYRIERDGTGFSVLHHFDTPTGTVCTSHLILGLDGFLYGTTEFGGANNEGVAFRIAQDGSGYTVLWDFDGATTGHAPYAMVQATSGDFFGVCYGGGLFGGGTIFKLSSQMIGGQLTWTCTSLRDLDILSVGGYPAVAPIQGSDGAIYGMTSTGGAIVGSGTLFKINTDGSGFTVLKVLDSSSGGDPTDGAALVEGQDGSIYGTTHSGGLAQFGTIFRCSKDGSRFDVVDFFDPFGASGANGCGLFAANDGHVYGTTSYGDPSVPSVNGVVYRFRVQNASWENYGQGLAGTNGIPSIRALADPILGTTFPIVVDNSRGVTTGAFALGGLSRANLPLKGGTVLVGNLVLITAVVVPMPSLVLNATLQDDPALAGLVLDLQFIEADPGAVKGLSFTPGLELVLGY